MSQLDREEPLGLVVHSLPTPQDTVTEPLRPSGRLKLLAIMLVCSLPVIASYYAYFVVRPQGKASFIWVFDLGQLMHGRRSRTTPNSQVMILRHRDQALGLLVDDLHAVTQFDPADIEPSPLALLSESMLTTEVIKANQGRLLIQAVNAPRLFDWLIDGIEPPGLNPAPLVKESSTEPLEALAA